MIIAKETIYLFDTTEEQANMARDVILDKHSNDSVTEEMHDKYKYIKCLTSINTDYEKI